MNKYIIYLLVILLLIIVSFFVGRSTISISEKTKFIKGETVHKTITKDSLIYKESIPQKPELPLRPIIIYKDSSKHEVLIIDTAKIISEYTYRRTYKPTLFDDKENGKLKLGIAIQYNKIDSIGYEFTPVTKEITKTIERIFTPFIQVTYNSFGYIETGGGIYYHDIAIQGNYITNFNEKGFSIGMNIKF